MKRSLTVLALLAAPMTACDDDASPPPPRPAALSVRAVAAGESPRDAALDRIARLEGSAAGWAVLASRGERVVYGRPLPRGDGFHGTPAFSDVKLIDGASQPRSLGSGAIVDTAVSASRIALLDAERKLRVFAGDAVVFEANDVAPGLSFSPDGETVAFATGTVPELDVAVGDERGVRVLADDPAPDYLPVFSEDGSRIAFVSSRAGFPALWSMPASGGVATQITGRGVSPESRAAMVHNLAPDGRTPPLWSSGTFVFFDGRGVTVARESGDVVGRIEGAREPLWLVPGRELSVLGAAGEQIAVIPEVAP